MSNSVEGDSLLPLLGLCLLWDPVGRAEALMKRSPCLTVYCACHQLQTSHLISSFRILWGKTAVAYLSLQLLGILKAEFAMHFL